MNKLFKLLIYLIFKYLFLKFELKDLINFMKKYKKNKTKKEI